MWELDPCHGVALAQPCLRCLVWSGPSAGALLRLLRLVVLFALATSRPLLSLACLLVAAAPAVEVVALELLVAQPLLHVFSSLPSHVELERALLPMHPAVGEDLGVWELPAWHGLLGVCLAAMRL